MQNLATRIEDAKLQLFFQHNPQNTDGFITIAKKEAGRFRQYFYKPEELAAHLTNVMGEDVFFSQNTFYRKQRRIETIRQLRSLYVDLDFYIFNYTPEQILYWLEADYFRQSIPQPNMIIFSGQGIVLIWLIEPLPYKALPLWQAVQNYLINQLKELGGDPKAADAARIFRLAGSTSSKNGNEVTVKYYSSEPYNLREIQEGYLPDLTEKPKKKKTKGRKKKVAHLFNVYSLHAARLHDLSKLVAMRDGDMTGCREIALFLYRYWTCCFTQDPQEALQQTLEFNRTFTKPLSKREAIRATTSAQVAYAAKSDQAADKKAKDLGYPGAGYRLSNTKLIEWLGITPAEQEQLKTIIGAAEKRRRNTIAKRNQRREAGVKPREEYLKQEAEKTNEKITLISKILDENPNLSIRKLAEKTGLSKSAVQRLKARHIESRLKPYNLKGHTLGHSEETTGGTT